MTRSEVAQLHPGDEVYWTDPASVDNDPDTDCSKYITIHRIEMKGEIICIQGNDGSYLECFAHELS